MCMHGYNMRHHPGSAFRAINCQQSYFDACVVMLMKLHCKVTTFPITSFGHYESSKIV